MYTSYRNTIKIGALETANSIFLAPMSGVTDLPFRQLAHEFGAGLVFSEMVASKALVTSQKNAAPRLLGKNLRPHAIQLVGHDPDTMAEAARIAIANGADIIDINMGCPAREVTGKMSGSALMREPDLARKIIDAVVNAVPCPVTLKMRLGWDVKHQNAPELAEHAEQAGVKLLTVHARTRCQFFKGRADWAAVSKVTRAVNIPVIINGDISSIQDVNHALSISGANGVMVGRAAYGAPWKPGLFARSLCRGKELGPPLVSDQRSIAFRHVEMMLSYYGHKLGLRKSRKHIGWYLNQLNLDLSEIKFWRRKICTSENAKAVFQDLAFVYDQACEAAS